MTRRYTGGFLSATEQVTDANNASGLFTVSEAGALTTTGNFPTGRWTPQRSLRFRSGSSANLSRTPSSAGNQRTWTWSAWVKRGSLTSDQMLFSIGNTYIRFGNGSADTLWVNLRGNGATNYFYQTTQVFRDPAAWYHIVVAVDTTQAVSGSRVKIYANGSQITAFTSYADAPPQNHDTGVNYTSYHTLGSYSGNSIYFDGYMSEVNLIDGQQLDPTYFAATDPETGTWIPKRYTGTYGTNGFYLPFNDNTSLNTIALDKSLLSTELITNGNFNADVSGWTVGPGVGGTPSITLVSGTARITNSSNNGVIYYQAIPTTVGNTYYVRGYVSNISIGGSTRLCKIQWSTAAGSGYSDIGSVAQSSGSGWISGSFVATTTTSYIHLNVDIIGTGNQGADWDNITVSELGYKNHWNTSNISLTSGTSYDSMVDVPGVAAVTAQRDIGGVQRGNYPTFNPLWKGSAIALSEGNCYAYNNSSATYQVVWTTQAIPPSGKYYWEFTLAGAGDVFAAGIGPVSMSDVVSGNIANQVGKSPSLYSNYSGAANLYCGPGYSNALSGAANDIINFAYDADTGKIWIGKNGTFYAPIGGTNTSTAHGATFVGSGIPSDVVDAQWRQEGMIPYMMAYNGTGTGTRGGRYNFGQTPFAYTPPPGFRSLCTSTLPTPIIKRPEEHFDTKLYSGSGTTLTVGNNNKQITSPQIANSLRFRGSTAYRAPALWRSFSTSGTGGAQKWTYSVWVKRGFMSNEKGVLLWGYPTQTGSSAGDTTNFGILYETNGTIAIEGQNTNFAITSQSYIDKSKWHHVVVACDTTITTAGAERLKLYVDGVRVTSFSTQNSLTLNQTTGMGLANNVQQIGARYTQMDLPFDGFMAETNFVDGQALTPASFGQFDASNNWLPVRYTGTYGTNGWYLPFTTPTLANAGTSTYAGHFDGSTQYLTTPSSANLAMGTGAFTVEFWMNLRAESNNNLPIVCQDYTTGLDIRTGEGGANQLGFYLNNATWVFGYYPAAYRETWQHVAVVRTAGGAVTMYVGGSPICTTTNTGNCTANTFRIGELVAGSVSGTGKFNGSISNVRVVKGTAVYTSQFTPPTGPLTAISGTQLLALQSATATADASTNNFTLTNTGTVVTDVSYPMAKTVGVDASGNGNDFNQTYNIATPTSSVLTYGNPGTYTWVAPAGVTSVKALVIAGGGGGGGNGGGGGAGGMIYNSSVSVTPGTSYTVTVGAGGRGANGYNGGMNGQNSVFASLTAIGGGRGGAYAIHAAGNGGSGGGGVLSANTPGTGTAGQGYAGGSGNNGNSGNTYYHGGGGGAGGVGYNGGDSRGGPGLANSITGVLKYYAGGGGGHYFVTNTKYSAVGGIGGGGDSSSGTATQGKPNTGGGGGSGGGGINSSGGSGVVILSYTNANTYTGQGANVLDNHDIFVDSPTEYDGTSDGVDVGGVVRGSYAKFNNSIRLNAALPTVTSGGLTMYSNTGDYQFAVTDLAISSGKWYWEYMVQGHGSSGVYAGIVDALDIPYLTSNSAVPGNSSGSPRGFSVNQGGIGTNYSVNYTGANITMSPTLYWEAGDIIQFALDADKKLISVGKNGTWVQSQVPSTGANAFPFIGSGTYYPFAGTYEHPSFETYGITANFGQKPFAYAPPTGFKSINTKNLRDVGSYNLPDNYGKFVNTPDFVWTKARTGGNVSPRLYDTVRGPGYSLGTNSTGTSGAETNAGLSAFLPNGFQLYSPNGAAPYGLENGYNYAAWCWNRGVTPGFDIVTWAGTGAVQTINHNLGAVPKFIITKSTSDSTYGWSVYHASTGPGYNLFLNTTGAANAGANIWNSTAPTNSSFTIGTDAYLNYASKSFIAYVWSEVPGFSKFGSYTGNASSPGPFIYTGFKPAFVLIKGTASSRNWVMFDNKRTTYNSDNATARLMPNTALVEDGNERIDFVSNGFKLNTYTYDANAAETYVYIAFAESPFKYAHAR